MTLKELKLTNRVAQVIAMFMLLNRYSEKVNKDGCDTPAVTYSELPHYPFGYATSPESLSLRRVISAALHSF